MHFILTNYMILLSIFSWYRPVYALLCPVTLKKINKQNKKNIFLSFIKV